jgi:L-asparaginase
MNEKNAIKIITTGGTFDKHYNPIEGQLTFSESYLPSILADSRCTIPIVLEGPLAIDSLYMTDEQREDVVERILNSQEKQVIVIHGTDTMCKTAELCLNHLESKKDKEHTIVFTGAMVPYALKNSDAVYNLGCAQVAVQLLDPGVYVAMNGKTFKAGSVIKDKKQGLFVEK